MIQENIKEGYGINQFYTVSVSGPRSEIEWRKYYEGKERPQG